MLTGKTEISPLFDIKSSYWYIIRYSTKLTIYHSFILVWFDKPEHIFIQWGEELLKTNDRNNKTLQHNL